MKYSLFAKYRSELMGIAILNVLVLHSLSWIQPKPSIFVSAFNAFGHLIFTEGFLFLSGFGLYYSLNRNNDINAFYKKRVQRLIIPYWAMTMPFFITYLVMGSYGWGTLLLRITTLDFWFHGNYAGMWYVAISVVLYACFPLIYRLLNKSWGGVIAVLCLILLNWLLYKFAPSYYSLVRIGITPIPFFIIGAWVGKQAIDEKTIKPIWILVLLFALVLLYTIPICPWLNFRDYMFRIVGVIFCCYILYKLDSFTKLHIVLKWFGEHTLEIYILHLMIKGVLALFMTNMTTLTIVSIGVAIILSKPVHVMTGKLINTLND